MNYYKCLPNGGNQTVTTDERKNSEGGKMEQKLLIKSMCCQMHPDLFEKTPQVNFVLRHFERQDRDREIAEFWIGWIEAGLDDPGDPHTTMISMNEWGYNEKDEWAVLTDKVVKNISLAIKWAVSKGYSVRKSYEDDYFRVFIKPSDTLEITLIADRKAVCVAVPTGNKKVIPAIPEKIVDEVEWVCEKISFLGVE